MYSDDEASPDKSESYSSSGGEDQGQIQRSPPDGAFDSDDLEASKVKIHTTAELKSIPISRVVCKPPTASETAAKLPPSNRGEEKALIILHQDFTYFNRVLWYL